ncbi:hypothetical protein CRH09_35900 [Nocardia terpenica]|uniref:Uncharacterized protein n=2 Tax=Nocardia terpenica TaxID=455432 RepID=A0A291RU13_9NOCA|nr:hypothetical protein CRH09_35900 [Nocardia terpenica]
MVKELAETGAEELPGMIFDTLPHQNPLVILPEPLRIELENGNQGRLLGFFVYGSFNTPTKRRVCGTHDERRENLSLMFITEDPSVTVDGTFDHVFTKLTIPVSREQFSVDDAVQTTLEAFLLGLGNYATREQQEKWLGQLIRIALNILIYLCTEQPDVRTVSRASKKKPAGKPNTKSKPSRMIQVGWSLGPTLEKARRVYESQRSSGTGQRSVKPHQRRAHYHTYWTGKGRTTPKVKFIKPFWVNLSAGETADYTVIPVH